jgi:hypothetical protein
VAGGGAQINTDEFWRRSAASALAFAGLALIKVWFWLELQKNAIVREVKRLEVQVASLAAQLRRPWQNQTYSFRQSKEA